MYTDPKAAYLSTRATSSVHDASPHKLISLLFDACLEKLAVSRGAIERGEVKAKAENIKKALEIIVQLQTSLDFDKGGEVAIKLDDLYSFCTNRLALANALSDADKVEEVMTVISEIRLGWAEIKGAE